MKDSEFECDLTNSVVAVPLLAVGTDIYDRLLNNAFKFR